MRVPKHLGGPLPDLTRPGTYPGGGGDTPTSSIGLCGAALAAVSQKHPGTIMHDHVQPSSPSGRLWLRAESSQRVQEGTLRGCPVDLVQH
jgi:hypothetical protein